MIRRIGIFYHVGVVVLIDGMDKLHDVMGGVGEVRDWRVRVQTHGMELITVLNVKRKYWHLYTEENAVYRYRVIFAQFSYFTIFFLHVRGDIHVIFWIYSFE